jgi:predicted aspartyl protease
MGRVALQVDLANHRNVILAEETSLSPDRVRRARVPAVVDTGAAVVVLPKTVAVQLGVPVDGKTKVRYADNRRATRSLVSDVEVELCGRLGTFTAVVEPSRTDVLIGAIVLEALDLLVDCRTQTLQPRDPNQILTKIE